MIGNYRSDQQVTVATGTTGARRGRPRHRRSARAAAEQATYPTFRLVLPPGAPVSAATSSRYARYIGRVGALAVALGVGTAVATGQGFGLGVARADETANEAPADPGPAAADEPADGDATPSSNEPPAPVAEDEDPVEDDPAEPNPHVPEMNYSGGVDRDDEGSVETEEDEEAVEPTEEQTPPPAPPTKEPTPPPAAPAEEDRLKDAETQDNSKPPALPAPPNADPVKAVVEDEDPKTTPTSLPPAHSRMAITVHDDVTGSQQTMALSSPAAAQDSTLTTAQAPVTPAGPVDALMAIPNAVVNVATAFVGMFLSPFLAPGPAAPAQPPLLFALLGWVQREIQRAFFNRTPDAVVDAVTTSEGTPTRIDVLGNDTDADGNPISITSYTQPAHGTVVQNTDGTLTYTPTANYNGPDSFTYTVRDQGFHLIHDVVRLLTGQGPRTDTATVNLTITAVNDAPTAVDDTKTTTEDTPVSGNVLTNDTDIDTPASGLTAALGTQAAKGTAVVNPDGTYTYTPNTNVTGTDTFTYTVSDGTLTDTGQVTITITPVNDAPVAVNDSVTTQQGIPIKIAVLANDTDAENSPLTPSLMVGRTKGTLTLNADKTYTYTPPAGYSGPDGFSYKVNDGTTDSNIAIVEITVTPDSTPNTAPVAVNNTYNVDEGGTLIVAAPGFLGDDTDADGDTLTASYNFDIDNGTIGVSPDGSFDYKPSDGFSGTDTFTYTVSDGKGGTDIGTVTINVNPATPENRDPVAGNNRYSVDVDGLLTVPAPGVLGNDTDADGDTLTATFLADPEPHGSIGLSGDGALEYKPLAGFSGIDTFTYTVSDGKGGTAIGTVTIYVGTVPPDNTDPVAVDDTLTVGQDGMLSLAPPGILENDTDADGDALEARYLGGIAHGTLGVSANGIVNYTPSPGYVGFDQFTYELTDGNGGTDTATVTIRVVAPAQRANDDTYEATAPVGTDVEAPGVLANDTDPDGGALPTGATVVLVEGTKNHVSFGLNPDGSFTYTPKAGFVGTDTFTYKINYGLTDSAPATVTINVNPAPPQVANDDNYGMINPGGLAVQPETGVLANDFADPDGGLLPAGAEAVLVDGPPLNAAGFNLNPDGSFQYTPKAGFTGDDTFTYRINYGGTNSEVATVTITVTAAPPPQVITDSVDHRTGVVRGHVAGDNDARTYAIDGEPSPTIGTVEIDAETGEFVFTPTPQARLDAYHNRPNLEFATFTVTRTDGGQTVTAQGLAQIHATNAVAVPLTGDLVTYGPPVVRSDGTAYTTASTLLDPNTDTYRTTVVVISPTRSTPTIIEFDGFPLGGVVFGPDGTAYQATQQGHRYAADVTTTVLAISPDASSYAPHVINGRTSYAPIAGPDGRVYQITDNARPGPSVNTTWVAAFSGANTAPVIATVDGSPYVGFDEEPLGFGPDGKVYMTTTVEDVEGGFDSTAVTRINPNGTTTPVRALDGRPLGSVVFAPNGDAYQVTAVSGLSMPVETVVTNVDTGQVLMTVDGEAEALGPVTFAPNGTAFLTTVSDDPDSTLSNFALHVAKGTSLTTHYFQGRYAGDVQFGSDGTAYQYIAAVDPDTLEDETLVVITPAADPLARTIHEFPGQPVGMIFGPDGDVYQIVHTEGPDYSSNRTTVWRVSAIPEQAASELGHFAGIAFASDGTGYLTTDYSATPVAQHVTSVTVFRADAGEIDRFTFVGAAQGGPLIGTDGAVYQTIATRNNGAATTTVAILSPTGDSTTIVFAGEPFGPLTQGPGGLAYQATGFTDPITGSIGDNTVWIMDTAAADVKPDTAPVAVSEPVVNPSDPDTGVVTGFLNVVDADGDSLTYSVDRPEGAHYTVTFDPSTGAFTYTPSNADRLFGDQTGGFTVFVSDGQSPPVEVDVSFEFAPADLTVVGEPVRMNDDPGQVEVSPDGTRAYVTAGSQGLVVFDVTTDSPTVVTSIPGLGFAKDLAFSADGRRVYVATDDGVSVVDGSAATPSAIDDITIEGGASAVELRGNRLYAANPAGIAVFDVANDLNNDLGTLNFIESPSGMALSPDGKSLYVAAYDPGLELNVIHVVDMDTFTIATTINLYGAPREMTFTRDGDKLFVLTDSLIRIDTASRAIDGSTVPLGVTPGGMAVAPDGSMVYTPSSAGVHVYRSSGVFGIGSVDMPTPWDIAVSPDGSRVYTISTGDNSLRVIALGAQAPTPPEEPEVPPV